jgi:hypothetical protein
VISCSQSPQGQRLRIEPSQRPPERACCFAIDVTADREVDRKHGFRRHDAPGTTVQIDLDAFRPASAKGSNDGYSGLDCHGVVCHRARGSDRRSSP